MKHKDHKPGDMPMMSDKHTMMSMPKAARGVDPAVLRVAKARMKLAKKRKT